MTLDNFIDDLESHGFSPRTNPGVRVSVLNNPWCIVTVILCQSTNEAAFSAAPESTAFLLIATLFAF